MYLIIAVVTVVVIAVVHLVHIQWAMDRIPDEINDISPHRWTEEEIRETYERIQAKPIDFKPLLPPRLNRRYVVVGGSGMSEF
jgi:hypothetical protein